MSSIPKKADVVVIGGGPAGSMAAGLLSQKGFDVVLLEKARHPRPTVGESILPHFWKFTDMLGDASNKIESANFVKKAGGIVKWNGSLMRTRFKEFGHDRTPLHVNRDLFDKILLDTSRECGAQVFEETAVNKVEIDRPLRKVVHYRAGGDGATGQIESKFVVDASGQAAVIAKQQGFRIFDDELRFSAMWGYYQSSRYLDYEGNLHSFENRFDISPVTFVESIGDWGWTWNILLRDRVSVGIILPAERVRELKSNGGGLDSRFQAVVAETPYLSRLLDGAHFLPGSVRVIRDYAYKPVKLTVNDCYLVGDAAAFVDPINSAGVTFGMYAAVLAAWSIERAMKKNANRELCQKMFEDQYRKRLDIFRLVALPTTRRLSDAETDKLCSAFRQFSEAEKQLALTTTILTNRSENVRYIFDKMGIEQRSIASEIPVPPELL